MSFHQASILALIMQPVSIWIWIMNRKLKLWILLGGLALAGLSVYAAALLMDFIEAIPRSHSCGTPLAAVIGKGAKFWPVFTVVLVGNGLLYAMARRHLALAWRCGYLAEIGLAIALWLSPWMSGYF